VAKAEAYQDSSATKVFLELRDVNYPGSTYTLTYNPASDQLQGIVLLMTDDVSFGADSTFGGAIPTPTFDRLAGGGGRLPH
jgi:hypothetical protein